jgi:hypothetical protein
MQETLISSLSWTVGNATIENLILPRVAGFILLDILNIETGDPPAGWGVRRTISNKEFRTAEVIERNKTMFFTSTLCGSLFCGSYAQRVDS